MRLLSDAAEYALRSVVWLAQQPAKAYKVREIAEATHAAPGYLIRALQALARAGILSAQRGSTGGFTLERAAADITVLQVIAAVDPIERLHTCPLGLATHGKTLCSMHRRIDEAMAALEAAFAASTIADLIADAASQRRGCRALISKPKAAATP